MKKIMFHVLIVLLLLPAVAHALAVNDKVTVNWKGKWYNAVITEQNDANFRIHYVGYDNSWDEWVNPGRIRIQVLWKGTWYPAAALETSGSRVKIHYVGYDNSWDEWVTLDRIRSY